jgi:plastocyanin
VLALGLVLASLAALCWAAAGVAEDTAVEPAEDPYGLAWRPAATTVGPGGAVAFRSPGKAVPHGLAWTGGPEKPSCNGVPVDSFGSDWSGSCTFARTGSYAFVCTVHPEMQGTVVVSAGETPAPAPVPPTSPGQPAAAPSEEKALQALRLIRDQRGGTVRGSLSLSATAVGGKLTLELRARRASLGAGGTGTARVGRLVRSPLKAGQQRFALAVTSSAQRALRQRGRLVVTVEVVVAPPNGIAASLTRRVVLHA